MTPQRENRLIAMLFLACWGFLAGISGWITHVWWLKP